MGLTIAEVRPGLVAVRAKAESMIGPFFFGIPLELFGQTAGGVQTRVGDHLDELENLHVLVMSAIKKREQQLVSLLGLENAM
ncbi:MAG: hypothetical protein V8S32_03135 [Lachnospiraceae bacterium]